MILCPGSVNPGQPHPLSKDTDLFRLDPLHVCIATELEVLQVNASKKAVRLGGESDLKYIYIS